MYGKLFATAYTGSMFGAGLHVFAVWGYVIANKDADQFVELNPHLLAAIFGCSKDEVQKAIDYLAAPDTASRSNEEDGRRITPAGQSMMYHVVNGKKYDEIRHSEVRRAQNRLAQKNFRATNERADRRKPVSARVSMGQHGSAGSAPIATAITRDTARDTTTTIQDGKPTRPTKKAAPRKRVARVEEYSGGFEALWKVYPKRPNNSKAEAWRQWQTRLDEGVDPATMIDGVVAYAEHVKREGTEPRFVKQAATFLGRDRHFETDYSPVSHTPSDDDLLRKASPEMRARIARIESIAAEDAAEEKRTEEFLASRSGLPRPSNFGKSRTRY